MLVAVLWDASGTTLETVRLGGEIDDNIALLRELFEELSAVYGRQFKQRKKRLLTDEDLEERHGDINTLMRLVPGSTYLGWS